MIISKSRTVGKELNQQRTTRPGGMFHRESLTSHL